jgi:methylmalonyl-CoA mutase N-terminal domain/subunit
VGGGDQPPVFTVNPAERDRIVGDLSALRARRAGAAVTRSLDALRRACEGRESLLPPILDAVEALATVGEICRAMEDVFGVYEGPA